MHEVQLGETIEAIADKYKVSVLNIVRWNDLEYAEVGVGQILVMSPNVKASASVTSVSESSTRLTPKTHIVTRGQTAYSIALGYQAGYTTQGTYATAIGWSAGSNTQGAGAVAIGYQAGNTSQGATSIAIGSNAGQTSQAANSIAINASASALNPATTGFFVAPVRSTNTTTIALGYNTATNEISATAAPPLTLSSITATTATLSAPSYGYYYYITNSGFSGITLPASIPTAAGQYWVLRNTTATYLSVTVTNPTTSINSPISIAPQTSVTITVSGTGVSSNAYILF
jgi:LysM repeat protein